MTAPGLVSEAMIVRGRWIVRSADEPVLADGAIVVRGTKIEAMGPWERLREEAPDLPVLGGPDVAVLPGFVVAHHHGNAVTSIQQGIGDDLLELWLLAMGAARSADPLLRALVTATRLLRGGVTSVVEMGELRGSPQTALAGLGARLDGYQRSGIRAHVAPGVTSRGFLVPERDEPAFLAALPPAARAAASELVTRAAMSDDEYLAVVDEARRSVAELPRVHVWYGVPGPQWVSDSLLSAVAAAAEAADARVQLHVSESFAEKLHGPRDDGRPNLVRLRDLGVLSPRLSIAHGVWLTDEEISVLAESRAAVAHNPSSNLRLRAGIGPLRELLAAGVTVGIGLDANGLADDDDPFAEVRLALRLQRDPDVRAAVPSLADVYGAATVGGARLLGREADLGRVEPGFVADLVLVDLSRATWPWFAPEADPLELVLLRAHAGDVRTVVVGGEVVLRDGRPTRFDADAAAAELAAQLAAATGTDEPRRVARLLRPHLADALGAWERPALEPRIVYSSRR